MSDEENKAIEIVENITRDDLLNYWEGPEEPYSAIRIVLNLIQKQQEEIEKKDKIIDLMSEKMAFDYDINSYVDVKTNK